MKRALLALLVALLPAASRAETVRIKGSIALAYNECADYGYDVNSSLVFLSATSFRGSAATTVVGFSGDLYNGNATYRGIGSARAFNGKRTLVGNGVTIYETIKAMRKGRIYYVSLLGTLRWNGGSCSYRY